VVGPYREARNHPTWCQVSAVYQVQTARIATEGCDTCLEGRRGSSRMSQIRQWPFGEPGNLVLIDLVGECQGIGHSRDHLVEETLHWTFRDPCPRRAPIAGQPVAELAEQLEVAREPGLRLGESSVLEGRAEKSPPDLAPGTEPFVDLVQRHETGLVQLVERLEEIGHGIYTDPHVVDRLALAQLDGE